MEKSRQIGITVRKVTAAIPMHVWVCSKDEETAIHYLEICKEWATILQIAAEDLGERIINSEKDSHCDRFCAKALRQHAASQRLGTPGIAVA
jgi:phage FluMu gp28-like protein